MALVAELAPDKAPASAAEKQRETCGLLWAAILLSLEASALTSNETEVLSPLLFACLEPTWKKNWAGVDEAMLHERARKYLDQKDMRSQIRTASNIADCFVASIEVAERGRRRLAKRLAVMLGHRMLDDVHRLNEIRMNFRIQLSLVVLIFSSAYLGGADAVLRLLRIA